MFWKRPRQGSNTALGYQEILRASMPHRIHITILAVGLSLALIGGGIARGIQALYNDHQNTVAFTNVVYRAIDQPQQMDDPTLQQWASAVRALGKAVMAQHADDADRIKILEGYGALYDKAVKPVAIKEQLGVLAQLDEKVLLRDVMAGKSGLQSLRDRFYSEFFVPWKIYCGMQDCKSVSNDLLGKIWFLFPMPEELSDAYAALSAAPVTHAGLKTFLSQRPKEISAVLQGNLAHIVRPVAPAQSGAFLWVLPKAILLALASFVGLTYVMYLCRVKMAGFSFWQVRWSILTWLIALVWSIPIVLTVFYVCAKNAVWHAGKLSWAILTGDIGRLFRILRGKEASSAPSGVQDEALTILFRRLGEIGFALDAIELRKADMDTDAFEYTLRSLQTERDAIDRRIKALQSAGPPLQDAKDYGSEQLSGQIFRVHYDALRVLDPSLPR